MLAGEQTLLGIFRWNFSASQVLLINDLNLKPQDNRPDETQSQRAIAVDDIVSANVLQVHVLLLQEQQRLVNILQTVDPHLAARWPRQPLRRQDLEQTQEDAAVAQVNVQVLDAAVAVAGADEVGVDPFCECFLLDELTLDGEHLDAGALEQARRTVAVVELVVLDTAARHVANATARLVSAY